MMIDQAGIRRWFDDLESQPDLNADDRIIRPIILMADAGILKDYCEEKASRLFELESSDPDANYALRITAQRLLEAGKTLPPRLAGFVKDALMAALPFRRGRPPQYLHNIGVVHLIEKVCAENGLHAARSPAEQNDCEDSDTSDKISACKFVADALGWKERKVQEIWSNRDKLRINVPQPPKRRKAP